MEWTRIAPQRGQRATDPAGATIAARVRTDNGARPKLTICLGRSVTIPLGVQSKGRVHVDVSGCRTMMRLAPTADKADSYSVHSVGGGHAMEVTFSLAGIAETHKAEPMAWSLEPGAVLLTLPDWVRGAVLPAVPQVAPAPASVAKASAAPVQAPQPADGAQPKWTEERKARLRQMWADGAGNGEIAVALNALPGLPIHRDSISPYARTLLSLPDRDPARTAPPAPTPPPAKAPAPPPPAITTASTPQRGQDGTDSRADLPAAHPDKAEATSMLEAGLSARHVAEEFGLPLATVATWAAEVRARKQGRAA